MTLLSEMWYRPRALGRGPVPHLVESGPV